MKATVEEVMRMTPASARLKCLYATLACQGMRAAEKPDLKSQHGAGFTLRAQTGHGLGGKADALHDAHQGDAQVAIEVVYVIIQKAACMCHSHQRHCTEHWATLDKLRS